MNYDITNCDIRPTVDQPAHGTERGDSFVQFSGFAVSVDGETEDGFSVGAGEDGVGAGTRVGSDEIEEEAEEGWSWSLDLRKWRRDSGVKGGERWVLRKLRRRWYWELGIGVSVSVDLAAEMGEEGLEEATIGVVVLLLKDLSEYQLFDLEAQTLGGPICQDYLHQILELESILCRESKAVLVKTTLASKIFSRLQYEFQVDHIHEVKPLNDDESLKLFNLNAFKQNHDIERDQAHAELTIKLVNYANGNPLALKVYGRSKEEWEIQFLRISCFWTRHGECLLHVPQSIESLSEELRLFEWNACAI
ncbi:hypothetical protein HN51_018934 [Arachis hypogaea]